MKPRPDGLLALDVMITCCLVLDLHTVVAQTHWPPTAVFCTTANVLLFFWGISAKRNFSKEKDDNSEIKGTNLTTFPHGLAHTKRFIHCLVKLYLNDTAVNQPKLTPA